MVGEVFATLGGFKTMYDMAKALKDINDATIRNAAVIELQEKILAAREAQAMLLERVGELEKQVAGFETWNAEKEKYDLKQVDPGAFAYVLKPEAGRTEPPHWLCATCYADRKKSLLQYFGRAPGNESASVYKCQRHGCGAFIRVNYRVSPSGESQTPY